MESIPRIPTIDAPPDHEVLGQRTEMLRVALEPDEVLAKGTELATRMGELADLLDQHAEVRRTEKAAVEALKATISDLRLDVVERSERRPVICTEIANYKRGVVEVNDPVTGAIVRERPITDEERQRSLQ